jgi:N-acetylneuraminic acid mutarotase
MKWHALIIVTILVVGVTDLNAEVLQWSELPDLRNTLGVAGAFSGISSDALVVAGGANFPEPLFKDGQVNPLAKKTWWDRIYVLAAPDAQWLNLTCSCLPGPTI